VITGTMFESSFLQLKKTNKIIPMSSTTKIEKLFFMASFN
jgi:hypothetical protein